MSAGVVHILCITQITFLIILYKTHSWLIIDGFGFGFRGIPSLFSSSSSPPNDLVSDKLQGWKNPGLMAQGE